MLGALLRRARIRNVTEGKVQIARVEATEGDTKDAAERWQDYGFAGNPGDAQGLVINFGGHTVVIRADRIAERPQLAAFEVAMWHKEGHSVKLKAGGVIELNGASLTVNMTGAVTINSTALTHNGKEVGAAHQHLVAGVPAGHTAPPD
jgi:phage gp45-like